LISSIDDEVHREQLAQDHSEEEGKKNPLRAIGFIDQQGLWLKRRSETTSRAVHASSLSENK
jgi:hypothetical protein